MNMKLIKGAAAVLCFFMAVMFAHISAACVVEGLSFFYAMWCLGFSMGAILSTIEALDVSL